VRISNIANLGVKELRSLARDPVMCLLIAWGFSGAIYAAATVKPDTLSKAPIGIVDEDQSPLSLRISSAFYLPYFTKPTEVTQHEMDSRMDSGLDTFALDIPPDFQRDVLRGRRPAVQLNVDATRMDQAYTGQGYIQYIVTSEVQAFLEHHRGKNPLPIELDERVRFNPQLTPSWFGGVMELINQVTILAVVLTGAALIREREHGTVEHLLVMPVTPFEIMTAKVWANGLVVLVACGLSVTVVIQSLLRVPIQGSIALFLVGAAFHLFASTSLGIFLGTIARSMPQFGLLFMITLMPLLILSGGLTPRESMPEAVQTVMLAAPTTHFVRIAQGILYRGAGLEVVWKPFVVLFVIGAALFGYALARFRATIGTMM
jgi:ABC-2 type transport system permease protein